MWVNNMSVPLLLRLCAEKHVSVSDVAGKWMAFRATFVLSLSHDIGTFWMLRPNQSCGHAQLSA